MTTGKRAITGEVEKQIADRDQFHFTEVVLESLPNAEADYFKALQPILDQLANIAGSTADILDHPLENQEL